MKYLTKGLVLSSALFLSAFFANGEEAHAQTIPPTYGIKVQVNDELIKFPDAKPFIDSNERTQVPIRFVAEEMGYQVHWEPVGNAIKVVIKNNSKTIEMITGEQKGKVNGVEVSFGTNALLQEDRTYVPLRFIGETMGSLIQWDNNNDIAIVGADGKYHAPAWYKPKEPAVALAAIEVQNQGEQIVDKANDFIGVPYLSGGTTPKGFDCSGFVRYVFDLYNIDLPRTSQAQHRVGISVSKLQPGDLVFFAHQKKTSHVGIYVGNNRFISATSSRGIRVDSLDSAYWGPKYVGAQRVL